MKHLLLAVIVALTSSSFGIAQEVLRSTGQQSANSVNVYGGVAQQLLGSDIYTEEGAKVIRKALKDELQRNISRLQLEDLAKPFFISYEVREVRRALISATLGSIVRSSTDHSRSMAPRLMVGSYERNDENFLDISGAFSMSGFSVGSAMPLENDYDGIRRALWLSTDRLYKSAADSYEKKLAAIKQQNLQAELASLPDFSKEKPQVIQLEPRAYDWDVTKWENTARDLSTVFNDYPEIQSSRVAINLVDAIVYFVNNEGTDISYPVSIAAVQSFANTQADDGEIQNQQIAFYALTPDGLPDLKKLRTAIDDMAKSLVQLRKAIQFDDTYSGPVMIEGNAVGELIAQRLFMNSNGLIATRDQISTTPGAAAFMGSNKSLGDRIGNRILPRDISITAKVHLKEYKGAPLIGAYEVDREGVIPPEKLVLVEKGKLMTLLNDRVPSKEVQQSNGHERLGTSQEAGVAPSVIHMQSSKSIAAAEMKDLLIQTAKDEGLKYAIIVRKIASPTLAWEEDINPEDMFTAQFSGGKKEGIIRQPILIYKVDVETGEETLVRSAEFGSIGISSLRDIMAVEDREIVYNTLTNPSSGGNMGFILRLSGNLTGVSGGFPSTFIVPHSMLFEELEIKKINRTATPKLPVVDPPLSEK